MSVADDRADEALLVAGRSDAGAFGAFYRRRVDALLAFFLRRTGDRELAVACSIRPCRSSATMPLSWVWRPWSSAWINARPLVGADAPVRRRQMRAHELEQLTVAVCERRLVATEVDRDDPLAGKSERELVLDPKRPVYVVVESR